MTIYSQIKGKTDRQTGWEDYIIIRQAKIILMTDSNSDLQGIEVGTNQAVSSWGFSQWVLCVLSCCAERSSCAVWGTECCSTPRHKRTTISMNSSRHNYSVNMELINSHCSKTNNLSNKISVILHLLQNLKWRQIFTAKWLLVSYITSRTNFIHEAYLWLNLQ